MQYRRIRAIPLDAPAPGMIANPRGLAVTLGLTLFFWAVVIGVCYQV